MQQIDRQEDGMCTADANVSPYLRRRLRSYEEVVREASHDAKPEARSNVTGPWTRGSAREATGDV